MQKLEVTLTNRQIIDSSVALGGVRRDNVLVQKGLCHEPVEIELGFNLGDNLQTIVEAADRYYDYRKKILEEHATKDEKGELITDEAGEVDFATPEAKKGFEEDLKTLLEVAVPLNLWTFTIRELKEAGVPRTMPELLSILGKWMIVAPPPEDQTSKVAAANKRIDRRRK